MIRKINAKVCLWSSVAATILSFTPATARSQNVVGIGPDSVETVPVKGFAAGSFWRKMLGDNYRELWTMPIRVLHTRSAEESRPGR